MRNIREPSVPFRAVMCLQSSRSCSHSMVTSERENAAFCLLLLLVQCIPLLARRKVALKFHLTVQYIGEERSAQIKIQCIVQRTKLCYFWIRQEAYNTFTYTLLRTHLQYIWIYIYSTEAKKSYGIKLYLPCWSKPLSRSFLKGQTVWTTAALSTCLWIMGGK